MTPGFKKHLYIVLGWLCVIAGIIAALLPVIPTTPFLILALALFSKSSERFHQMLLNNRWVGPSLKQWEETHTVRRKVKVQALVMMILAFSVSIYLFSDRPYIQLALLLLGMVMIAFILRLRERD